MIDEQLGTIERRRSFTKVKRLLICGDRGWGKTAKARDDAKRRILLGLSWFIDGLECIVEGGASGVDDIAGEIADELELDHIKVHAHWKRDGTVAGPIRNRRMLTEYKPDAVLYFHGALDFSKGTRDCVNQARELGIPVYDGISLAA